MKPRIEPVLFAPDGEAEAVTPLPRAHEVFDEKFLQDLLADHPNLLPVDRLRSDVGDLLCIGREVPTRGSGAIDNLFLSTGGYAVVIETKLWRNPQARREVVSQVLDYVTDIVTRDFDWLESVWQNYCKQRGVTPSALIEALSELDDDLDEQSYFDRLHGGLERGDVLALIVGDGIESRLQQLVDHLCRHSAHLRYSLGLVALHCYQFDRDDRLLALPELIQHVEPVERAHVRVDVAEGLQGNVSVTSVVRSETQPKRSGSQKRLGEEEFYQNLTGSVGDEIADKLRDLVDYCVDSGLKTSPTTTGLLIKMADPLDEAGTVPLLGIHKDGLLRNPRGLRPQLETKWGWSGAIAEELVAGYWGRLNGIDRRFPLKGLMPLQQKHFVPIRDVSDRFDELRKAMTDFAVRAREVSNGLDS